MKMRHRAVTGIGVAGVTVLAGAAWWAQHGPSHPGATHPGATHPGPGGQVAGPSVHVDAADLRDPARLRAFLTSSGIAAKVQVVPAKVINGVRVVGCAGPGQEGLPQLPAVLGAPPQAPRAAATDGIMITPSAMPAGAVLSFVFWAPPGSAHPVGLPVVSLHQGTPPACTPPTDVDRTAH